jgi:uncharacterized membrane protein (UPF0127 family)
MNSIYAFSKIRSMMPRLHLLLLALLLSASPSFAQSNATASGQPQNLRTITLHIDHATLNTQVAATEKEQETGLMFVTKMADNDGMIFLLPTVTTATFWMKDTLIPLSIAYIDQNGVILDIHDMQPADPHLPDRDIPLTRSDTNRTAYALETNLHWFALNGIKPGDKIEPPPSEWSKPSP